MKEARLQQEPALRQFSEHTVLCLQALGMRPEPGADDGLNSPYCMLLKTVIHKVAQLQVSNRPEVGDAQVGLLAVAQVRLGYQDVAHGQHAQAANLLG